MSDLDRVRNRSRNKRGQFKKKSATCPSGDLYSDTEPVNVTDVRSLPLPLDDHNYMYVTFGREEDSEHECTTSDETWKTGRRIVELDTLADHLKSCFVCANPLYLHNTVSSKVFGLASVLEIVCEKCSQINSVHTGRKHGKIYNMNTKLAIAMAHAGVGVRQINSILSALDIPPVSHSLLVRRQNEAGQALENVAKASTEKFLQQEVNLNLEQNNCIEVSVDAGWQKRGSGKAYDSLSGHCSMIGIQTGKVLSYAVRSKTCRVCNHDQRQVKGTCKKHDCRKNWSGSAKSMEPDMVAEMITETAAKGIKVTGIIGDDDTTTAARIKLSVPHSVEKRSDKNHVQKNLSNTLYNLKSQFPVLTTRIINYLKKLFNYCISQHKHDPAGISRGLDAIVCHTFGNHAYCDDTWCRVIKNPSAKYSSLPYGRPLKDVNLRQALQEVFTSYKKYHIN